MLPCHAYAPRPPSLKPSPQLHSFHKQVLQCPEAERQCYMSQVLHACTCNFAYEGLHAIFIVLQPCDVCHTDAEWQCSAPACQFKPLALPVMHHAHAILFVAAQWSMDTLTASVFPEVRKLSGLMDCRCTSLRASLCSSVFVSTHVSN